MLVRMTCPCQEPISLIILLNRTVKTWAWKLLIFHVQYNIRSRESKAVTYMFFVAHRRRDGKDLLQIS